MVKIFHASFIYFFHAYEIKKFVNLIFLNFFLILFPQTNSLNSIFKNFFFQKSPPLLMLLLLLQPSLLLFGPRNCGGTFMPKCRWWRCERIGSHFGVPSFPLLPLLFHRDTDRILQYLVMKKHLLTFYFHYFRHKIFFFFFFHFFRLFFFDFFSDFFRTALRQDF